MSAPKGSRVELLEDWYSFKVADAADCTVSGIYEWNIEGIGIYIGKYTHIKRPKKEYRRNVLRLLNEEPYRKSKPVAFRYIHTALAEAVRSKRKITLTILENPPLQQINQRERELIEREPIESPKRLNRV